MPTAAAARASILTFSVSGSARKPSRLNDAPPTSFSNLHSTSARLKSSRSASLSALSFSAVPSAPRRHPGNSLSSNGTIACLILFLAKRSSAFEESVEYASPSASA
jgi:hypothetical protein